MTRRVIFHYHIFKNAGSTVEWCLRQSFGNRFERIDPIHPRQTLPPIGDEPAEGRPDY